MATKKPAPAAKKAPARRVASKVEENLFSTAEDEALHMCSPITVLKIKRLTKDAVMPTHATVDSACVDITTTSQAMLQSGRQAVFDTGLAFEVPKGYALMVYSRSGHGFKHGIRLANSVGIIDSDYRGELKIALRNDSAEHIKIYKGDRIAQAMLIPLPWVTVTEVDELSETERGEGGLGSTGR